MKDYFGTVSNILAEYPAPCLPAEVPGYNTIGESRTEPVLALDAVLVFLVVAPVPVDLDCVLVAMIQFWPSWKGGNSPSVPTLPVAHF
jgi:hypothetical protein